MDVGIVIVSYNTRALLKACLTSLFTGRLDGVEAQVWVVDNASADDSAAMVRQTFPQVRLLDLSENVGFARANNLALRAMGFGEVDRGQVNTRPRYVWLLNPDTEVLGTALPTLVSFLDSHPEVGAAGPRLIYPDGRFQHSAFAFPGVAQVFLDFFPLNHRLINSRLNGRYPQRAYTDGPFAVDHPLGAALMVRGEVVDQVGLLDEGFFMYCEEVDWCMRIKRAGWQVYCVPQAWVVHHGAQSTRQVRTAMFVALWRSRFRFFAKYYTPWRRWAIRQIVRLGLLWEARRARRRAAAGELSAEELQAHLQALWQVWQLTGVGG